MIEGSWESLDGDSGFAVQRTSDEIEARLHVRGARFNPGQREILGRARQPRIAGLGVMEAIDVSRPLMEAEDDPRAGAA